MGRYLPSRLVSVSIWTASSRVGARMRTLRVRSSGIVMMRWKIEIRKAAVLPVPVWDCA